MWWLGGLVGAVAGLLLGGLALVPLVNDELMRREYPPLLGHSKLALTLAAAVGGAGVGWRFYDPGTAWPLVALTYGYLVVLALVVSTVDLRIHILPNRFILPAYVLGPGLLAAATWVTGAPWSQWGRALAIGILAYVLFFLLSLLGSMGFGDVKLAGVLGLFLGWLGPGVAALGVILAFLGAGLWALGLVATRRATGATHVALGPWLGLGAVAAVFLSAP